MKAKSIFQLRKTTSTELTSTEIRTVNFQNDEIQDENIKNYFSSRIKFLSASYDFAKEMKLEKDFDFSENAETKDKVKLWLVNNQQASMVDGTEFDVITTKVIESIKSVQQNKYLKELKSNLLNIVFIKNNSSYNPKYKPHKNSNLSEEQEQDNIVQDKLKKELTEFKKLSLEDILQLTSEEVQSIFNYELINKSTIFLNLLKEIQKYEILNSLLSETIINIELLNKDAIEAWKIAFAEVNEKIKNPGSKIKDYSEIFVLQLYFSFDGKMRQIEDKYLEVINSNLNSIKQSFAGELLEKNSFADLKEEERKQLNSKLQNVWNIDWNKLDNISLFIKNTDNILDGTEISELEDTKVKTEKLKPEQIEFSLRHPKSAPNFPSLKEKKIVWDKDFAISNILKENKEKFNSLKFLDYLLFRVKKIIENSDVYKIWRHINDSQNDFEWVIWLENILDLNGETKFLECKFNQKLFSEKLLKAGARQLNFIYQDDKENNRLPYITISPKNTDDKNIVLEKWLKTHYLDLSKFNIEIGLLRELTSEKLLDTKFVNSWYNLLNSDNGQKQKFAVRTEKRLQELKNIKVEPNLDVEKITDCICNKLTKIEKHLLLDKNHDEFKIFDKLSFDKYKKLAQVVFESVFTQKTDISISKANLAKLTLDVAQVLPIKISRMTSNRPNGKSTLVFEISNQDLTIPSKEGNVLIYPVNMKLEGGSEVKIVNNLSQAIKELNKKDSKYTKLMAGFLNGNADNKSDKTVTYITKKDGSQGQFTKFGEWKLVSEDYNVSITDENRIAGEDVAGTNPAGYPKLYFFLIPKVCNNLIIPVETNSYYLGKYTPYNHLKRYLELEKEIYELEQTGDKTAVIEKVKEVLKLRTYLRNYYRISSLELDLIRDYKLVIDKETKQASIKPIVKAKVHFQFGNPRKVYTPQLVDTNKPPKILSIDLGEKHLAVATLSEINWAKWSKGEFKLDSLDKEKLNYFLQPLSQTFLPLGKEDLNFVISPDINLLNQEWNKFFDYDKKTKKFEEKPKWTTVRRGNDESFSYILDVKTDGFWEKYTSIIARYKSQQKQIGVVNKNLASSKINLTKKLAEQIASQIVKIAKAQNAIVVFENLSAGFGRQVETVRLYTQIRRLTAQKLGEVGLLNTSFVKGEADLDNYATYEFNQGLFSIINPSYTSKTCSCCGFVPIAYKPATAKKTEVDGVKMNTENWQSESKIEFSWKGKVFCTVVAKTKEINTWIIEINNQSAIENLSKTVVFTKSSKPKPTLEVLQSWLFTEKEFKPKTEIKPEFLKWAIANLFKPRQKQSDYVCPYCGNSQNADYQASYNIGLHFLIGNKIVQERKVGGVEKDLKKGLVKEISARLS